MSNSVGLVRVETDTSGPRVLNDYDAVGRLIRQSVRDASTSETTEIQYDARDRITQITDPMGRKTKFKYDLVTPAGTVVLPEPVSITDPEGHATSFTYDLRDRLSSRTDAKGGITRYGYDFHGNLTSLTDPGGNQSTFKYDVNNRLIVQNRPSVSQIDNGAGFPVGNVATTETTTFTYDTLDELTSESYTAPAIPGQPIPHALQIVYTYDPFNRLSEKLQQVIDFQGNTYVFDDARYTYQPQLDAVRLATANNFNANLSFNYEKLPPFSGVGFSVQATDPANSLGLIQDSYTITREVTGNVGQIVNSKGRTLYTAAYDPAGRLSRLSGGKALFSSKNTALEALLAYDGLGRKSRLRIRDSTGVMDQFISYNLDNQVSDMSWRSGTNRLMSERFIHDLNGNISEIVDEGHIEKFVYDPTNQLISAHIPAEGKLPAYHNSFEYDPAGNRTHDGFGGSAQFLANAILQNATTNFYYSFSGDGNVTFEQDRKTQYFSLIGHLPDGKLLFFGKTLKDPNVENQEIDYSYDALGRRISKQFYSVDPQGNSTLLFTQSYTSLMDQDRILLAKAGDGKQTLYLDGQGIDEHLGQVSAAEAKGYETDYMGSVLNTVTAGPGREFYPWGGLRGAHPEATKSSEPVFYGFAGREWDPESETYYNRARQYDPRLGRFTSTDPSGFAGGDVNVYRYVKNNPVRYKDPRGTDLITDILGGLTATSNGEAAGGLVGGACGLAVGGPIGGLIGSQIGGLIGSQIGPSMATTGQELGQNILSTGPVEPPSPQPPVLDPYAGQSQIGPASNP